MKLRHGIRVAIHTANLIYPDCNNKSQAIYTQDFPPLAERASAHSQVCRRMRGIICAFVLIDFLLHLFALSAH